MTVTQSARSLVLILCLSLLAPPAILAQPQAAHVEVTEQSVLWSPLTGDPMVLTISGPSGDFRFEIEASETAAFDIFDQHGALLQDGSYTWQIITSPYVSEAERAALQRARANGLPFQGTLPQGLTQSGALKIQGGYFVLPTQEAATKPTEAVAPNKDEVIADDLIVVGKACIGQDCTNGQAFGFDTLRLKENNPRIQFEDTSSGGSFPSNDWQLTANESSNGGLDKFSIEDINIESPASTLTPFTIEAGAPSHSFYVDDIGQIGLGTSTPVVEVHVAHGDSPTLRLEQDGSKGLTSQIWDMAGNEAHWSVRDVTHDTTPLKIYPSAPTDSLIIGDNGDVGLGTALPEAALNLVRDNGTAQLRIQETSTSPGTYSLLHLETTSAGNVRPRLTMTHSGTSGGITRWNFDILNQTGNFAFIKGGTGGVIHFTFEADGDFSIPGRFVSNGIKLTVPDYVFADDYALMPLDEVRTFIDEKKHLPEVPSAAEVQAEGLDLTHMQLTLLKKVEELTLYTLDQHETIRTQQDTIRGLNASNQVQQDTIQDQQAAIQELLDRVEALEASRHEG